MMLHTVMSSDSLKSVIVLGGISILNSLFNRIIMTKFFFDYPIVILMLQMAVTLFSIEIARLFNWIKLPAYTFQRGKDMFLPSVLYALSTYLGMNCLDGIAMPLFPPIQRFCPLIVIAVGAYLHRQSFPNRQTLLLIEILCIGGALSCFYELSIDMWSIVYGIGALVMHAVALVMIERLHENFPSTLDLVYMNSFNCLCLFLIADLVQDEIRDAFMYMITSMTMLFVTCLTALVFIGVAFHTALFYCTTHASALHASIVQNISGALQIFVAYALSVYLFYDLAPTWTNILGVIICIAGAIGYYKVTPFNDINKNAPNTNKFFMLGKA
uniref:Sugar phosphate transporter domain-containing protein n=1 Tax=Panagrolaimus sp. ES5 TaxID=591445 RepID=A0AC34GS10_9BILA